MNRIKTSLASLKSWPVLSTSSTVVEPDLESGVGDVPKAIQSPGEAPDSGSTTDDAPAATSPQIEDYPEGYPRYSALVASHDFCFTFRSFRRLRARLLLKKQDEISVLEEQLDIIDREEPSPFFLASCREDKNEARAQILAQIQSKFVEYDALANQCRQALSYSQPPPQVLSGLRSWLDNTGFIVDEEMTYLEKERDLVTLASSNDPAMKQVEDWVEKYLIEYYKKFREGPGFEASSNKEVYTYSGALIKTIATCLMLLLIILLLLLPIVICMLVENMSARISIIVVATACFLAVLARLTKARMIELILAGATFATVLNVFISNS